MSGTAEIIKSLKREGYSSEQIQGRTLVRQLGSLIRSARLEEKAEQP